MNNFHKMTKLNIFYFTYSNYLELKTINFDKMSSATALLRNRPYLKRSYSGHSQQSWGHIEALRHITSKKKQAHSSPLTES